MSAKITLTSATFSATPGQNQTATVMYRLQSAPDIAGSYTTVTTNAVINTAGQFTPPVVIPGLQNGVTYVVRVINNCSNQPVDKPYTTPLLACVQLTDVVGTAEIE